MILNIVIGVLLGYIIFKVLELLVPKINIKEQNEPIYRDLKVRSNKNIEDLH